eukprot:scaffold326504_cov57-Tisochrysis_lutea.AAC.1
MRGKDERRGRCGGGGCDFGANPEWCVELALGLWVEGDATALRSRAAGRGRVGRGWLAPFCSLPLWHRHSRSSFTSANASVR